MSDTPPVPPAPAAPDPVPQWPKHVADIYAALQGRPVLLPIEREEKGPFYDDWEKITFEKSQDPAFTVAFKRDKKGSDGQKVRDEQGNAVRETYKTVNYADYLSRGNIGVMLGSASVLRDASGVYHLCSIDIDEDDEVEPFLLVNPRLRESLMTRGRRGGNIWLWIAADGRANAAGYPQMAKLVFADGRLGDDGKPKGWGEWRSETHATATVKARRFQTVIYGLHPAGMQYKRVSAGLHPLRVDFSEIVWPESVAVPWRKSAYDELVEKYGEPWFESKKGALTLNPPFFVAKYSTEHDVLHEPEELRFYDYCAQRGLWIEDSEDAIRWKISEDFKRVADDAGKPAVLLKRTNAFLQGLVHMLKGCVEKRQAFAGSPGIVHLLNGMLNVKANPPTLADFDKSFFSRNQLPVEFREGADCPRFKKELMEGAFEADDILLLQKWVGQLLLGVNLTQKIMLITGVAGTGKSTFMNLVSRIIGEANYAGLRTEHLHERFELANYVGKTFLIGADVPGNFLMTEGAHWLKKLVGKDVIPVEMKHGKTLTITGTFNVGLTSNSRTKVRLDGDGDAWGRRLLMVHCAKPPPAHPNPHLADELFASEASGILNWGIQGAMILLGEIAAHNGMIQTARQRDMVRSLLAESDSLREFVRKSVAAASDRTSSLTTHELTAAYVHYCEERGWNPLPTRKVENLLPDVMLEIHRLARRNDIMRESKSQKGYHGVRLLTRGDDAPPATPPPQEENDDATPFG